MIDHLADHERISPNASEFAKIKDRLRTLYIAGPGAKTEEAAEPQASVDEEEGAAIGARIPIPPETFIEELSQKLEIHPISIYWLLEEMREEEGLVCPPEERRHAEDYLTIKVLRMLGHRWPMQDDYEKKRGAPFLDPAFIDADGIIPLTQGQGQETMAERLRSYLDKEFGADKGPRTEAELTKALGWKPGQAWGEQKSLSFDRWLTQRFFRRHVSQFKKRPIAWHLSSPKGGFQALCYYHRFDRDGLTLLRTRYVASAIEDAKRALGEAQQQGEDRAALAAIADAETRLEDLTDFDDRLRRLLEGAEPESRIWCPWKEPDEQPKGWSPDINDGVRVNIAPIQRLGLLAADVLSKKDLNSLLALAEVKV